MPAAKRIKTQYPGVYFVESTAIGSNRPDRIYYIRYRKGGRLIEEKAGRQSQDDMTPARANATRIRRIEGGQTNAEARADREAKKKAEQDRWTIGRLWEAYTATRKQNKALKTDEGRYRLYLEKLLGGRELISLVPLDIDRIRINLLKTKSPQTVKHVMGILKRINNFAISKGLAPGLNFSIQAPRVDNIKTEDLNAGQIASLFEAIRASNHLTAGAMMQCALFTGMRRGEMFKLRWTDIDFERGFITLRDPKGGTSQKIPLNESARGLFSSLPRSSEFVFPGRGGRQRVDINKQLNEIKTAAGLPKDFRPLHGLRHTYASMLASSGQVDMFVLQKLLTHKTPAMTQRYAHLRDDALKRAAGLAGEIIGNALDECDQDKGKPGKNNIANG